MITRKHIHEETFDVAPEIVFDLLVTPSAIREWWGASHVIIDRKQGGLWVGLWGDEDSPEYITACRMSVFEHPKRIVFSDWEYYSNKGPCPFDARLTSDFSVIPVSANKTVLRVVQDGFPTDCVADEFYAGCERGWHETFVGIRRHLETASVARI